MIQLCSFDFLVLLVLIVLTLDCCVGVTCLVIEVGFSCSCLLFGLFCLGVDLFAFACGCCWIGCMWVVLFTGCSYVYGCYLLNVRMVIWLVCAICLVDCGVFLLWFLISVLVMWGFVLWVIALVC